MVFRYGAANRFRYICHQMDEKQLVARAQAGDWKAFTELLEAHKTKIYALVRRLAANPQDAEDVIQETLLKAIDNIDRFRGDSSFGTWLYTIALNQARAHFAGRKRVELKPIEDYLPGGHSEAHDTGGLFDWQDPHRVLEAQELREVIDKALAQLPYHYREAFLLRYIEDLPVKEVARVIGESEAATKSRILRARLALREYLSSVFEESYAKKGTVE